MTNMATLKKAFTFGEYLRNLREDSGLTLKAVSEQIGIDISLLAKIERNERQASKNIIGLVAKFFNVDQKELQREYISDQIAYKILGEEGDLSILKDVEDKVKYFKTVKNIK